MYETALYFSFGLQEIDSTRELQNAEWSWQNTTWIFPPKTDLV